MTQQLKETCLKKRFFFQPLHDLAAEAASRSNEEEMILALKAIGNVGHPASLKRIMKFIPGYTTSAADLPLRVQMNGVMALRNLVINETRRVRKQRHLCFACAVIK